MASYSPGRGPNFAQYLANLNAISSPQDSVAQPHDSLAFEEDLALFTNVVFDENPDLGDYGDQAGVEFGPMQADRAGKDAAASQEGRVGVKPVNLGNADYRFDDMAFLPSNGPQVIHSSMQPYHVGGATSEQPFNIPFPSPTTPYSLQPGSKRPFSPDGQNTTNSTAASSPTNALEFSSRDAAEEDKRRRNTAASARFRVKKKQREQALEKTAKEMSDRAEQLEAKISQLEQENRLLRSLVVQKAASGDNEAKSGGVGVAKVAVSDLLKEVAAVEEKGKRSPATAKKGVGTATGESA